MKKITTKEFINRSNKVHNNKYDYSLVNYINSTTKIKIICKIHGDFLQIPKYHLNGNGCQKCANKNITTQTFIKRAIKVHGNRYNYNLTNYVNCSKKVIIICNKHGQFKQTPNNHLNNHGCPSCSGNLKLTLKSFIQRSLEVHNNKYNYSEAIINGIYNKVKIKCKLHGIFFQIAKDHLNGNGCQKCSKRISKKESQWLNFLNIKKENRQISLPKLPKRLKIDGYDPDTNTVYEFLGSYWHGDPLIYNSCDLNKKSNKTFGELYNKTINKEIKIRKAGYNYQFIWEEDWKNYE